MTLGGRVSLSICKLWIRSVSRHFRCSFFYRSTFYPHRHVLSNSYLCTRTNATRLLRRNKLSAQTCDRQYSITISFRVKSIFLFWNKSRSSEAFVCPFNFFFFVKISLNFFLSFLNLYSSVQGFYMNEITKLQFFNTVPKRNQKITENTRRLTNLLKISRIKQ